MESMEVESKLGQLVPQVNLFEAEKELDQNLALRVEK